VELIIKKGPGWLRKLIVVSHERSGTHFLMNTLAMNYGYVSNDWIDLDLNMPINFWHPDNMMDILKTVQDEPIANIFKSHHQVDFFLPVMEKLFKHFDILYIYRNERDVLESFYRHLNDLEWHAGPKVENAVELAHAEPCGGMLRYQWRQHKTCLERLRTHVFGWLQGVPAKHKNHVFYVRYEDLDEHFDETVRKIGNFLGRTCPEIPRRPSRLENVITPETPEETKQEA
jgi:hypothetical protein